jgi:hypothetical protein
MLPERYVPSFGRDTIPSNKYQQGKRAISANFPRESSLTKALAKRIYPLPYSRVTTWRRFEIFGVFWDFLKSFRKRPGNAVALQGWNNCESDHLD